MATRTSVGSGLWSAAGTWDTGVPADNDIVIIAAGHIVEFNVDQSGFANGIDGITVNGTLKLTRTPGTYYLKIKAAKKILGTGVFDCGSSIDPIPFATRHTIGGGAGWGVSPTFWNVYGVEPTLTIVRLSAPAIVGATVLNVVEDVTGDIWADGDLIGIDSATVVGAARGEERTIAAGGITPNSITITAGLTYAKNAGDYISLISRNVRFIGGQNCFTANLNFTTYGAQYSSAAGGWLFSAAAGFSGIGPGTYSTASYAFYQGTRVTVAAGIWRSCGTLFYGGAGHVLSGGFVTNMSNVFYTSVGSTMSGGTVFGCVNVFLLCPALIVIGGTAAGCWNVFSNCQVIANAVAIGANAYQIGGSSFVFNNVIFGSGQENIGYSSLGKAVFSQWFDYNGTPGAYKAWTAGGVTTSVISPVPTGYSKALQIALENSTIEGYWQEEILITPGASVNFEMWLRKNASMTYLPRCVLFNKSGIDPFAGGTPINTFTMTNSIDTWESLVYTYTNTGAENITLVIRFQGMNATGNMYLALTIEQINVDLTSVLANLAIVDAIVDAIKAKTDNLPTDPADESLIEAAISAIPAAPTAVQNRQEMDANSTRLSAINAKTTNLPTDPADESLLEAAIAAIPSAPSTTDIMNTIIEGTYTLREVLRIISGVLAGKLDGGGTGTLTFRDLSDSRDRVVATVDMATGDRDAITLDVS